MRARRDSPGHGAATPAEACAGEGADLSRRRHEPAGLETGRFAPASGPRPDALRGGSRAQSRARDGRASRTRRARGAEVVCLPELFRTLYLCQSEDTRRFDWAEPIPGPSTEALAKQAADLRVSLVVSLFERRAAGLYHNTAVVLDEEGQLVGRYRKMHIPDDPLYYEKFYFTPGDLGFQVHADGGGQARRPRLLGPVVSRGGARDGAR